MPFERTFDHSDWANFADTVDADEFNVRFNAIKNDLDALGEHVNNERWLSFYPGFRNYIPGTLWQSRNWNLRNMGAVSMPASQENAMGYLKLNLPDGAMMIEVWAFGSLSSSANDKKVTINFYRRSVDSTQPENYGIPLVEPIEVTKGGRFEACESILAGDGENIVDNSKYIYYMKAEGERDNTTDTVEIFGIALKYRY